MKTQRRFRASAMGGEWFEPDAAIYLLAKDWQNEHPHPLADKKVWQGARYMPRRLEWANHVRVPERATITRHRGMPALSKRERRRARDNRLRAYWLNKTTPDNGG